MEWGLSDLKDKADQAISIYHKTTLTQAHADADEVEVVHTVFANEA